MRVIPSELETARFGVRFGRFEAGPGDVTAAVAQADAQGTAVITARIDAADLAAVRTLEDLGFRIMDTLVYHRRTLPVEPFCEPHRVIELGPDDAPEAAALASRAFHDYLGHYHADPRLSSDAADAAYADWITRLLQDPEPGQIALGLRRDGRLAGFLAGRRLGESGSEIVLNAVDPAAQRGGVYTALLQSYLERVSARDDTEVVISTQLQNYAVQRAWSRAGFTLFASYHTLHRWAPGV